MHAKEIIFATALLTGGGCKPDEKIEIQQPHRVEECETVFKIPEKIDDLEDETRRRILQALNCSGFVSYKIDAGALREPDVSVDGEVVVLEDEAICIDDTANGLHVCMVTALQYQEKTMVNGFTISGLCAPSEYKDIILKHPDISDEIDLSKAVKERIVYENQPPPPPNTNYI